MEDCKPVCTPVIIGCKLSKEDDANEVDQEFYRSMTRSLLYVIDSRPDIMQVVVLVVRFQATPKETHVQAIKSISIYLEDIMFGSNDDNLSQRFSLNMHKEFKISMLEKSIFLLRDTNISTEWWHLHLSNQVCEINAKNI